MGEKANLAKALGTDKGSAGRTQGRKSTRLGRYPQACVGDLHPHGAPRRGCARTVTATEEMTESFGARRG
jgi:hypothetical protein